MPSALLSVASSLIAFGAYIPYARDILRGRVRPARSTRIMFMMLMCVALLQQHSLGGGWVLAVTLGEAVGSVIILALALKKGVGGLARLDKLCYILLALDIAVWLGTSQALLALHLTVLADLIAFTPTLAKTWRDPTSETVTFFVIGAVAPLLSILAAGTLSYSVILFPLYLALINFLEVGLICMPSRIPKGMPTVTS